LFGFGILAILGILAPIAGAWFIGTKLRDRDWPRWLSLPIAVIVLFVGYVIFLPAVTALDHAKCWRSGMNGDELQNCLQGEDKGTDSE